MGALCDFCGEQRPTIYCRSDAASLCLSCDRNVHSANTLSQRHMRTLLCDRCASQPAAVRCLEENTSLCQNCDWSGHAATSMAAVHLRQTINCYSGCPSSEELARIWSFDFDAPSAAAEPNCEEGISMMSINDSGVSNHCGVQQDCSLLDIANSSLMSDPPTSEKLKSEDEMNLQPLPTHQPAQSVSMAPKQLNPMRPKCSNAVSADSSLCVPARQAISTISLSFSGLTGESNAGDHQDCEVSPLLLMGEQPWLPPGSEGSSAGGSRGSALSRYMEKKKRRKFDKKIRYASRKARADVRKRVKGRFVKAGEAYDYDPLSDTRSY
ncbi:hypothetical protein CFC21_084270 [Triticum aestivum]|uniref:Uncharacterized protein n=2 Tax=Triticum aestivum TaxID=4565 RepID=A0A3B6NTU7_WHEAT|nr:hypothetical protein CFC21_084270 [Triticum aestivum]